MSFDQILPGGDAFSWEWDQLAVVVGNIVNLLLMLSASVAIIFIIVAGYRYITAFGNPEAAQQAKNTLLWAILGLILALLAYAIVNFIADIDAPGFEGGIIEPESPL